MNDDIRALEERRYGAITALKAIVECLKETNPQYIFVVGKDSMLDQTKLQSINNRWADRASDVLSRTLDLADRIGLDALDMFTGEVSRAKVSGTPSGDARPAGVGHTRSTQDNG